MATPVPRSYPQILGGMFSNITANLGIKKLKPGSGLLTILEAAAQSDVRQSQDVFKALQSVNLDNSTGFELDQAGAAEKLPRRKKKQATGFISVTDTSFTKIYGLIYHGLGAPIVGSIYIYVAHSPTFDIAPSSGQIYLGRGTANYEGPLSYTSKVDAGSYWTLTLSSPTTLFHNQGDTVILAQGGSRPITAGQTVSLPQGSLTNQATYTVTTASVIPDGETETDQIPILATQAGTSFNCTDGSINTFVGGPPFANAVVTNTLPITNGADTESDNTYRERIRQARNNKSKAIDLAIINSVIDVTAPDEPGSVTSSSLVDSKNSPSTLFIDDGTGYEAKSSGVGFEIVLDSANGGETEFFTVYSPIAQATAETQNTAPYGNLVGMQLTISVGEVETTHTFSAADFVTPQVASAYEVVSSINSDSTLNFVAKTSGNGTKVTIHSRSETQDSIQVITGPIPTEDANVILGFSTSLFDTTSLYLNDTELSKDGSLAKIASNSISTWRSLSGTQTLVINVDGTGANTYTFTDTDFIKQGYGALNTATTAVWAKIINSKIPGVTAAVENDTVTLTSNRQRSSTASLTITGGTLATTNPVFPVTTSQGNSFDYSIDRSVGSIVLENPLSPNDHLSLGTVWPEAFLQSQYLNNSATINLLANRSYWLSVDDPSAVPINFSGVNNTINSSLNALTPSATKVSLDIATLPCQPGDLILFTDENFDSSWRGVFRTSGTNTITVERKGANVCRFAHTATWAPIGSVANAVVVCGGLTTPASGIGAPGSLKGRGITNTAEYYDPATGNWTALPNMLAYRAYHTATRLSNGNVLVTGGFNENGAPLTTTEILNVSTQTWSAGSAMVEPKAHHTATVLSNGNVLIAGGYNGVGVSSMTFEYVVGSNTYTNQFNMGTARYGHQALLVGTNAMVFGGISVYANPAVPIASVELYSAGWTTKAPMSTPRAFFGACNTNNSKVLVMGNGRRTGADNTPNDSTANQTTYDVYTVSGNTWAGAATIYSGGSSVTTWNQAAIAQSFTTGKILAGYANNGIISVGYSTPIHLTYDPVGNSFSVAAPGSLASNLVGREGHIAVALQAGSLNDAVLYVGGINTSSTTTGNTQSIDGNPVSSVELYNLTSSTWSVPYDSLSVFALSRGGIKAIRSYFDIKQITIPTGSNYTANTIASALTAATNSIIPSVYKTTSIRLSTPSLEGALLLVDTDPNLLSLSPAGTLVNSQRSQFATIVSSSGTSTPADFQIFTAESSEGTLIDVPPYTPINGVQPTSPINNGSIIGLKNYTFNAVQNWGNAIGYKATIGSINNAGNNFTEIDGTKRITKMTNEVTARTTLPIIPGNPVVFATPYALTPFDTLTVTVDGNTNTNRFTVPMGRKCATVGTYQTPITLKDTDNNNNTLSTAFGTTYNFNDFVIYSRARAITDSADATKRILWRYYRYGAEGNATAIRYVYPTAPSQSVNVTANSVQTITSNNGNYYYAGQLQTTLDVQLPSGTARPNAKMSNNTTLGFAGTTTSTDQTVGNAYVISGYKCLQINTRTLNGSTTIRLQIPGWEIGDQTIQALGITAGDVLWFNATVPSSATLQTGQFTVASVSAANLVSGYQEIVLAPYTLNDGTVIASALLNPGDVSQDSTQKASFDTSVIVGDYINLGSVNPVPAGFSAIGTNTMRITAIGPTNQYVKASFTDPVYGPQSHYQPLPEHLPLTSVPALKIFASSSVTATSLAASINALTNPIVTATVTGTGAGNITQASWESGSPQSAYNRTALSDGINYVKNTNNPANTTIQTTFDLKLPINANLTSNNDFSNEIFYLSPALPQSVVQWLNTPAITGLWSATEIELVNNGTAIQISSQTAGSAGSVLVEGGSANLATAAMIGTPQISIFDQEDVNTSKKAYNLVSTIITVPTASTIGLTGNTWVSLTNTEPSSKVNDNTSTWGINNNLASIQVLSVDNISNTSTCLFTFSSAIQTTFTLPSNNSSILATFEKICDYVAVHVPRFINQNETGISSLRPGDYLQVLTSSSSQSNVGLFNIIRVTNNETEWTIWIQNPNCVQETAYITGIGIRADSAVSGDSLVLNTTEFGVQNKGTWTINTVSGTTCKAVINTTNAVPFSGLFKTQVQRINLVSGQPLSGIRKLIGIALNSINPDNSDLLLLEEFNPKASDGSSHPNSTIPWSQTNGTIISSLDKLGFSQDIAIGNDAYRYNTGLIAECKRVIYGDDDDRDNYPGYAANGASIIISGPTIKRIQITLSVRLSSNVKNTDIAGQIASAVAAVINSSPVGTNLAISNIVTAAQSVDGVKAVSVIFPAYDAINDQILIRGQEKPLVVNIEEDIKVIFAGV